MLNNFLEYSKNLKNILLTNWVNGDKIKLTKVVNGGGSIGRNLKKTGY